MSATVLDGSIADAVARAARVIAEGSALVAIPTETVYGLAANALDEVTVARIFAAKGRPADNPLIVHVPTWQRALPLWAHDDARALGRARLLADACWPGPLTIVCWRSVAVPDLVCAGLPKVAVRAPRHPVLDALFALLDVPIAAPSANASGRPSPTCAADVLASLGDGVALVLDGGPCAHGIESSVVDVTGEHPVLLRPGAIGVAELRALVPDLVVRAPGHAAHGDEASPGLRHRHYAPALARVRRADLAGLRAAWPGTAALLVRAGTAGTLRQALGARAAPTHLLDDDPAGFARGLFAALYRIERAQPAELVIEEPPDDERWLAVRDRLLRATS
jgi:L-threonylcarbamoyladenylate synthase